MNSFVLDASMTLSWYFADETSAASEAVFTLTDAHGVVVPAHWYAEVANGVLMGERRGRQSLEDSVRFFNKLFELDMETDAASPNRAVTTVLPLARAHGLTIYDALYLDLAERRGLPIATLDRTLADAARFVGLTVLGQAA